MADDVASSTQGNPSTREDIAEEGQRLVGLATAAGITMRLLGGVAIRLRCPSASQPPLARTYGDLDFVAPKRESRAVRELLESAGYVGDRRINALHGDRRLIFADEARQRPVDIFIGAFRMCHTLDLDHRLSLDPLTLTPADLLLTKLQIVHLNTKDALDALALLTDFDVTTGGTTGGNAAIDGAYIADLCAHDWGWYTTLTDNLAKVAAIGADSAPLLMGRAHPRIEALRTAIEAAPKSVKWNLRAAVGKRVQWYEEPEEIRR